MTLIISSRRICDCLSCVQLAAAENYVLHNDGPKNPQVDCVSVLDAADEGVMHVVPLTDGQTDMSFITANCCSISSYFCVLIYDVASSLSS